MAISSYEAETLKYEAHENLLTWLPLSSYARSQQWISPFLKSVSSDVQLEAPFCRQQKSKSKSLTIHKDNMLSFMNQYGTQQLHKHRNQAQASFVNH
jgi:hypothetical protein